MSLPTIAYKAYAGTADESNLMSVSYTVSYEYDDGSGGAPTAGTFSMTNSWLIYSNSAELTTWLASVTDPSLSATVTAIENSTDGLGVLGELYSDAAIDNTVTPQFAGTMTACLYMPNQASCLELTALTSAGTLSDSVTTYEPADTTAMATMSSIGSSWDDSSAISGLGGGW